MDSIAHAIQTICVYALPLIFAITLHEAAHGWVASLLGDPTAKMYGRVTVNPLPHIDPVGTIAVPVGLVLLSALTGGLGFIIGWAKPVPINPWNFRGNRERGMMLTALAGPASNAVQMIFWTLLIKFAFLSGLEEEFVYLVCEAGIKVNLVLMAFNLIPIPPLDGGRILHWLLPKQAGDLLDRIEPYGMAVLMVLMVAGALNFLLRPFLLFGQWLINLVL